MGYIFNPKVDGRVGFVKTNKEREMVNKNEEKKSLKTAISDFFYELNRKMFPPKKTPLKAASVKKGQTIFIISLLVIPVVHWLIFWLYVNMQTIVLSFQSYNIYGNNEFTLNNFVEVWKQITSPINNNIGVALVNTLKYFCTTIIVIMPLCLVVSFFIYKKIMFYKGFRIIFYLPAIISGVAMVTAYTEFVDPNGPLGAILRILGVSPNERSILAREETATTAIIVYTILTGLTTNVLLFGGGMARIPIDVLEAAKLDGVGPTRELCSIIFPLIWPTFSTQLIFTMTGVFSAGGPILLFTNGAYKTSTIAFWIFSKVYGDGTIGGASATSGAYNIVACAGLCFTMVGVPLILIARKLVEKVDSVEY